jgi:CubicO group peptidase (beta-lactamase class C family)
MTSFNLLALEENSTTLAIDKIVKASHRGSGFQGNVFVEKDGKVIFQKSYGFANREWQVPHDKDSKFMIASVTKQFTAYSILLLQEENKLDINDSISKYVKLPTNSPIDAQEWKDTTIKHLLTHSASIIRDVPSTPNMSTSDYNLLGTVVFNVLNSKNIYLKKKNGFYYSNLGYLLLAQVIEKVSKSYYGTFLKKHILTPLKMFNTGEYHRRKLIPKMADGYFYGQNRTSNKRCCHDTSVFTGSHNLYSTTEDLNKWQQELYRNNVTLNQSVISKMKEVQVDAYDELKYSFGLFHEDYLGMNRTWHSGHEWGYVTLLSHIEELDLTVIYLSNSHGQEVFERGPNSNKVHSGIVNYFVKQGQ